MSPKVSVLVPLWNTQESFLREAIDSVLNQTYKDFELILLNDSPENTDLDRIVQSYDDARIRYYRNEKNLGISETRNKLIRLAEGDYLAVLDHDDAMLPSRLEKQVQYMEKHPKVGVVGSNAVYIPSNNVVKSPERDMEIKLALMQGCAVMHSSSMIRKSVLTENNLQYEKRFSPSEDYALWCRLIPLTQFHVIQENLIRYRLHRQNTSKVQKARMMQVTGTIHAIVQSENPNLYREFLHRATYTTRIKFFGIPFAKIRGNEFRKTVYLFGFIPIIQWRSKVHLG